MEPLADTSSSTEEKTVTARLLLNMLVVMELMNEKACSGSVPEKTFITSSCLIGRKRIRLRISMSSGGRAMNIWYTAAAA